MTYLAPRQGIFAAIVLASLVLHLLFFVISAERGISAQNQQAVERSVMMLSQEIAAPLAAYDRVSMSVIAEPYVDEPMIAYVGIYDSQGGVLVPLGESAEGYRAEEVVTSGEQVLGKVVVQAKTVSRAEILSGNWVFLLSVIGLHIILWLIYGYVARPTEDLKAQIAKDVRTELLSKGILTEQATTAPAAHTQAAEDSEAAPDEEVQASTENHHNPDDAKLELAAAYTVQVKFQDPHNLLTAVSIESKEAYFALCDQLFERACHALLELPLFAGVAMTDQNPFTDQGASVTLYATDDHAKTAAAAALLSQLLLMVNEVVYQKHRELKRFALPIKTVTSDSELSDVAKSILTMRKEKSLIIFGEAGRNQAAMYMTLAAITHPSTVHERDGRKVVGMTSATADRLKSARDKALLGDDNA
ncbi:hypothetical protein U0021_07160 [Moraxella canis]|uniref:Uncharacterized protein n=1 Tax=Moraxella canis TaxID=90239 RepID=A0ABZ0WWA5_9GAMM|nr:hypothetical protein [Moraxella canis]WQE03522.1 hypothetical protein U0021_07160 [Moraxella canis]